MNMNKKTKLTAEGLKKLEQELEILKTKTRKDVALKIKTAISFGDLSENSEYDEAKNEQAIVEAKIVQIENILKNAEIVDSDELSNDIVQVGSRVEVKDLDENKIFKYKIVGSMETNPLEGKISDSSPVGSSLLGARVGDVLEIKVPAKTLKYEVINIER